MTRFDYLIPSLVRRKIAALWHAMLLPVLAVFCGLAGAADAKPTAETGVPTPAEVRATVAETLPYGDGVLWKVQRKGAAPSYVFGTIHLNRDDVLAVPAAVKTALAGARSASFEVLFDDSGSETMSRAIYTGGHRTLDALIGPDLFAEVVEAAEPYDLSVHELRNLKPWALMLLFSKPPSVHQSEEEGKPVLDRWLYEQAETKGIPTFGLETMRQHLSPFMDVPLEDQRNMVKALLNKRSSDQTEVERRHAEMVRHYLEGDIDGILAMSGEAETPEEKALEEAFMKRLLDDRNHLMVERMLPRLKEGKAFVAIGAGHLPGQDGILSLLTERGYSVERIH